MDTHQTLAPSATDNFLSAGEKAESLIEQLLRSGPRHASEILAATEGAKISARTIQRTAISLGVVKTKAGYGAGWVWRLPADDGGSEAEDGKVPTRVLEHHKVPARVESAEVPARVEYVAPVKDRKVSESSRAEVIAARLRKLEAGRGKVAPIYAADPRLLRWVEAGISDPDLREAYELAVYAMESEKSQAPLTAGLLDRYIGELI